MQIIKEKKIINDEWQEVSDGEPISAEKNIISLSRWQKNRESLLSHTGRLGLKLDSDIQLEEIADELKYFSLVNIHFKVFTDGRSFSQAWLLRNRYHFTGEIRASGEFLPDQVYYLSRVGIDTFNLVDSSDLETAVAALNDFSVNYQLSSQ